MQNKELRRTKGAKSFSFIVTLFDITLKLTQQASKNCRQTRRFSERRKWQINAYYPQKPGPT